MLIPAQQLNTKEMLGKETGNLDAIGQKEERANMIKGIGGWTIKCFYTLAFSQMGVQTSSGWPLVNLNYFNFIHFPINFGHPLFTSWLKDCSTITLHQPGKTQDNITIMDLKPVVAENMKFNR